MSQSLRHPGGKLAFVSIKGVLHSPVWPFRFPPRGKASTLLYKSLGAGPFSHEPWRNHLPRYLDCLLYLPAAGGYSRNPPSPRWGELVSASLRHLWASLLSGVIHRNNIPQCIENFVHLPIIIIAPEPTGFRYPGYNQIVGPFTARCCPSTS